MGPYCNFCDRRCFVERHLPFTTATLLMATCQAGMAHDRAKTGHDYTTAVLPAALRDAVTVPDSGDLEQARSLAVRLDGQLGSLLERMTTARNLLPELGGCTCVGLDGCDDQGDEPLEFERETCVHCRIYSVLLPWLDPTGTDRLIEALSEAAR